MLDHETGKTGFMEFVRFVDFAGEFKPITSIGGANIAVAMGMKFLTYFKCTYIEYVPLLLYLRNFRNI